MALGVNRFESDTISTIHTVTNPPAIAVGPIVYYCDDKLRVASFVLPHASFAITPTENKYRAAFFIQKMNISGVCFVGLSLCLSVSLMASNCPVSTTAGVQWPPRLCPVLCMGDRRSTDRQSPIGLISVVSPTGNSMASDLARLPQHSIC